MTEGVDRNFDVGRTFRREPHDDVLVLRLSDLSRARGWHLPALVVVDATIDDAPSLPVLAHLVMIRRRLRAAGGNLVVAASPAVAGMLRGNGLHWAVPACDDLTGAIAAVRRTARSGELAPSTYHLS
jgi:hypothetical protein